MSAHSATALGRCAMSRVAAELRRFRSSVQRSFDSSVALQISIAACIPRAQTQYLLLAGLKTRTGTWLHCRKSPALQRRSRDPAAAIYALGCIADIPAALQRRNAPETWLTPCVALADLTEALVQCKVIFCNIHTSWLQGLFSVARGPAALGWPQAACLKHSHAPRS